MVHFDAFSAGFIKKYQQVSKTKFLGDIYISSFFFQGNPSPPPMDPFY